jgi:hypothetical protein
MGKALGMGKKPMMGADEEEGEDYASPAEEAPEEEAEGDVPPDFAALYSDYEEAPSAKGLYDLIKSCEGMSGPEKPGGLALILGGKGKK